MDWYYKAAIAVALLWGAGRALGVYGEAARELDFSFFTSFMLTLGGWAAVFLIIDRVAKFLGWRRAPAEPAVVEPEAGSATASTVAPGSAAAPAMRHRSPSGRTAPRSRR